MMRVLFDTNVLLDVLLDRSPHNRDSIAAWQAFIDGAIAAHVTPKSLVDIFYIVQKHANIDAAWASIEICATEFEILPTGPLEVGAARAAGGSDFEDNLQAACARSAGIDTIVSRDRGGFASSEVNVLTPTELIAQIAKR